MSRAGRRDFWCRHHLWHSWELRRVQLFEGGNHGMWICKRCRMAAHTIPTSKVVWLQLLQRRK